MPENPVSKLADPQWKHERAVNAARSRTTPEYHLKKITALVERTRSEQGLPPVVVDELTLAKVADLIRSSGKGADRRDAA